MVLRWREIVTDEHLFRLARLDQQLAGDGGKLLRVRERRGLGAEDWDHLVEDVAERGGQARLGGTVQPRRRELLSGSQAPLDGGDHALPKTSQMC